jgi:hypothetical protein
VLFEFGERRAHLTGNKQGSIVPIRNKKIVVDASATGGEIRRVSLLGCRTIIRLGSGALGMVGAAAGVALTVAASAASSAPGVTKTSKSS